MQFVSIYNYKQLLINESMMIIFILHCIVNVHYYFQTKKERVLLVMSNIQDKVVIIMGASSGIGEATTKKLAQEGAKLVIIARREDRLKSLVESLPNTEFYTWSPTYQRERKFKQLSIWQSKNMVV